MSSNKKKDEDDMTTESYLLYKRARHEQPWNPWGAMPARGSTQQEDDESERLHPFVSNNLASASNPNIWMFSNVGDANTA
jgi:hypothetical protein